MIRSLVKLLAISPLIFMHSNALGQILLFYPDWFENPTFSVENNYSASSCVTVRNNDLQAAKETALINTRQEIASFLNGLPTEKQVSSLVAAKGVYLSTSQRVLDTRLGEELFCVLGSIPYSRIEEAMDTGLTTSELEQALKDLTPAIKQAARGIVASPSTPRDFYQNATTFAAMGDTDAALEAYQSLVNIAADFWDVHESFIEFARDFEVQEEAIDVYAQSRNSTNPVVLLASAYLEGAGTNVFNNTTDAITKKHPDCLACYGMLIAQYTYHYGYDVPLTKTQKGRQMDAFERIDRLGGVEALQQSFLFNDNFKSFKKTLDMTRSHLEQLAEMLATYGTDSLSLLVTDTHATILAAYKANDGYSRCSKTSNMSDGELARIKKYAAEEGLVVAINQTIITNPSPNSGSITIIKNDDSWTACRRQPAPEKPVYIKATLMNLGEETLEIKWRVRDHTEYRSTGNAGDVAFKESLETVTFGAAHLDAALKRSYQQHAALMNKGHNNITNEPYIRPSTEIAISGDLPPGDYTIDVIYTDLRGEQVGPLSTQFQKTW